MKNFRKISLGLLLSAQVLTTFYACSSDSLVQQESISVDESNLSKRANYEISKIIEVVRSDRDFLQLQDNLIKFSEYDKNYLL